MSVNIAERLKLVRGELTQAEFSSRLGIHKNTLGRYERGESKPDSDACERICSVFGVSPEWLLLGTGPMRPGGGESAQTVVPVTTTMIPPIKAVGAELCQAKIPPFQPVVAQELCKLFPPASDAAASTSCPHCVKLEEELRLERSERRELATEVRKLYKENGALREKLARLEERAARMAQEAGIEIQSRSGVA